MDEDATKPSTQAEQTESGTDKEGKATARRPGDKLDQDRESTETIPRKSSLL